MSAVGSGITYTLPVPGGHVAHDYRGEPFTADEVEWNTYIYNGQAYRLVRASGTDSNDKPSNCTWHLNYEDAPEWLPRPPSPWFFLANAIAAQATEVAS
jgi:hypothetical protein